MIQKLLLFLNTVCELSIPCYNFDILTWYRMVTIADILTLNDNISPSSLVVSMMIRL